MHLLCMLWPLLLSGWTALADSPFDQLALGALTVAGSVMETVQTGAAISKDVKFDTPLGAVRSKTAVGYGDVMRPRGQQDDDDDRRRRRRRRRSIGQHAALHRRKRTPCLWSGNSGATTQAPDAGDVDARRRRARQRATGRRTTNGRRRSRRKLQRRRRQLDQQAASDFGKEVHNMAQQMRSVFLSVVNQVAERVQEITQKMSAGMAQQ